MKKVTFIHHSSFLIELPRHLLLFDYTQGPLPPLHPDKKLIVFASHAHDDHYAPCVLKLPAKRFVFADDIAAEDERICFLPPHASQEIEGLQIETLRSTDEGVAFLVCCEGEWIYHAGDLHDWHWPQDSEQEAREMKQSYRRELKRIQDRPLSMAFVVLDPRLAKHRYEGIDAFYETLGARHVFPMHAWGDFALSFAYQKRSLHPSFHPIRSDGECFTLV